MLKRSWPRWSSAGVTGKGISATGLLLASRPVNTTPSRRSPRATVWAGIGRAPWPSAKKVLSPSVFTLCWLCMFCRQPAAASKARPAAPQRRTRFLVRNVGHLARVQVGEEAPGGVGMELGVERLDHQEVAVARRQGEARHVEHRVV